MSGERAEVAAPQDVIRDFIKRAESALTLALEYSDGYREGEVQRRVNEAYEAVAALLAERQALQERAKQLQLDKDALSGARTWAEEAFDKSQRENAELRTLLDEIGLDRAGLAGTLSAEKKLRVAAEARVAALEEALCEIVRREARSEYSSIYAAPGEFAEVARAALRNRRRGRVSVERANIEDVLAVIAPGETVAYADLIRHMKSAAYSTVGVGFVLKDYVFRTSRRGEIIYWEEPYWDDEVEGGWAPGTLWIKRRAVATEAEGETDES